jgi:hypothetical protein
VAELGPDSWLVPNWPAPPSVRACSTTRIGGVSEAPFDGLNLGEHVGDDPNSVRDNRRRLRTALGLPSEPLWLRQVHGSRVCDARNVALDTEADASVAFEPGRVCVVMTADCMPVLFCDRDGTRVGIAHAGWRGLASGVLEATVHALDCEPSSLLAWLGPAIGPESFEIGDEVRSAFVDHDSACAGAFVPSPRGRWLADLYALARLRLGMVGVRSVFGGGFCTFLDSARFYSYRRDTRTGRMASLIWLA